MADNVRNLWSYGNVSDLFGVWGFFASTHENSTHVKTAGHVIKEKIIGNILFFHF